MTTVRCDPGAGLSVGLGSAVLDSSLQRYQPVNSAAAGDLFQRWSGTGTGIEDRFYSYFHFMSSHLFKHKNPFTTNGNIKGQSVEQLQQNHCYSFIQI
ncbi:hypothetical protein EOD39_9781 [Acipenser ruthenus]|uniref:Uncharacterized protein n=1 Tax=Acipenser ruthenus TaxID=7906 RepID=A0A662YVY5_ACIRT|nr:hypothetical protein EOD39_9781 [Acipenser ruthenus]